MISKSYKSYESFVWSKFIQDNPPFSKMASERFLGCHSRNWRYLLLIFPSGLLWDIFANFPIQASVINHVPTMLDCVFESTLSMITRNFEDYPEIRESFYLFLNMVTQHCFEGTFVPRLSILVSSSLTALDLAILRMSTAQQKLVMQSVVWGFRHTMHNVSETALQVRSTHFVLLGPFLI